MITIATRSVFYVFLVFSMTISTKCALLEMSRILWNKTVSGDIAKIGRLDPLRVPLIKVDQSEGDASYRLILRNLEVVGLNDSVLESIQIIRGGLKSNLSDFMAEYMSYSDLRDVDSIRYRFHTMTRESNLPREDYEAVVAPINRATDIRPPLRYQDARFDQTRQGQQGTFNTHRIFEQNQQYNRRIPLRPYATSDNSYSGSLKTLANLETNSEDFKRPGYVQPINTQRTRDSQGYHERIYRTDLQNNKDTINCDNTKTFEFKRNQDDQRYVQQNANTRYYGEQLETDEVSPSEIITTRLKNQDDVRVSGLYNKEQSRLDVASSHNVKSSRNGMKERLGYIDIVYANDKNNGSVKRFGNLGTDVKTNRQMYNIEDVMKNIRENTKFIIYNFTEGEALEKKIDMIKAAMESKRLKDLIRYAKNYQEQQGYFEEGMQLIYHYGRMDVKNDSLFNNFSDIKRTKRAHSRETSEDDVMHVILRIRVPLLRVKSQYTLMGEIGKEVLRGNGLLIGNFTNVVGDFTLELKKINEELIIVRTARAKLSAKDEKINLQNMNAKGPVQAILNHGLMAAEAVAAMLADDFATKGLSERTADAFIYKMYKDLPVN